MTNKKGMKAKALRRLESVLAEYPALENWVGSQDCTLSVPQHNALINYKEYGEHDQLALKTNCSVGTIRNRYVFGLKLLELPETKRAYQNWEGKMELQSIFPKQTHASPYLVIAEVTFDWVQNFFIQMELGNEGVKPVEANAKHSPKNLPKTHNTILLVVQNK